MSILKPVCEHDGADLMQEPAMASADGTMTWTNPNPPRATCPTCDRIYELRTELRWRETALRAASREAD